jgi:hypothetical protein
VSASFPELVEGRTAPFDKLWERGKNHAHIGPGEHGEQQRRAGDEESDAVQGLLRVDLQNVRSANDLTNRDDESDDRESGERPGHTRVRVWSIGREPPSGHSL